MAAASSSSEPLYAPLPDASGWRGDARSVADVMDYFGRCLTDDGAGGRALLETLLVEISGVVKRVDSRLASIEASRGVPISRISSKAACNSHRSLFR